MKKSLVRIILLIGFTYGHYAQSPQVSVSNDTNNVLIGDRINLKFEVKSDKKIETVFPSIADTIGHLEVLKRSKIDTIQDEKNYLLKQVFTITSFDSGLYSVPSYTFNIVEPDDSIQQYITEPFSLSFSTVEVDTTAEIKDIKGPLDEPISWLEYLIYFIIAIALILLAFLGYYLWKRYRKTAPEELDYDPNIPPHVLALEGLKQLDGEKLWQNGYVKKYYIRLTDIIRLYIKRRFEIKAMEMITSEIIQGLRQQNIREDLINKMNEVFTNADFAKFAKYQPLPDINTKCMTLAIEFVNSTKKEEPDSDENIKAKAKFKSEMKNENNAKNEHDDVDDKSKDESTEEKK
jgi:hypothetical protein